MEIEEDKVYWGNILNNNKLLSINRILNDFHTTTEKTRGIRNSFTHRFPLNFPDTRGEIINDNGRVAYSVRSKTAISSKEIIENINLSHNELAELIVRLKFEFDKDKIPCS